MLASAANISLHSKCLTGALNYSSRFKAGVWPVFINRLTPNDPYMGRAAPLTSKRCILYIQQIQVLNILNMLYTLFFFLFKIQFVS
jgi:hypothetical protein